MSENLPITDATIADFRSQHESALLNRADPMHGQRTEELRQLYERRFAAPAEIVAPAGSASEYRQQHDSALNDRAHPDHATRVAELTKLHERDAVGGDEPAASLPAKPEDYDFARFKATVQGPVGVELVQDPELEASARKWMSDGGLSVDEGAAMASVYGQSLSWSDADIARNGQTTEEGLRLQFGDRVGEAAGAALRVAEEMGVLPFLEATGMINHHMVVGRLIDAAAKKGYLK